MPCINGLKEYADSATLAFSLTLSAIMLRLSLCAASNDGAYGFIANDFELDFVVRGLMRCVKFGGLFAVDIAERLCDADLFPLLRLELFPSE